MDNVINQSTVINGEKSKIIIGKALTGQTLSGRYTLIGCSGTVTISMEGAEQFTLINCPNLIVENPYGNNVPVIRDGYAIGDYVFTDGDSPAAKYGGYWEKLTSGTFLMSGDTVGRTGGEATHTLTISEMPVHDGHLVVWGSPYSPILGYLPPSLFAKYGTTTRGWYEMSGGEAYPNNFPMGSGQAHNNLPPYKTTRIYKRIKDPTTGNL